jgi:hypothetical protein
MVFSLFDWTYWTIFNLQSFKYTARYTIRCYLPAIVSCCLETLPHPMACLMALTTSLLRISMTDICQCPSSFPISSPSTPSVSSSRVMCTAWVSDLGRPWFHKQLEGQASSLWGAASGLSIQFSPGGPIDIASALHPLHPPPQQLSLCLACLIETRKLWTEAELSWRKGWEWWAI